MHACAYPLARCVSSSSKTAATCPCSATPLNAVYNKHDVYTYTIYTAHITLIQPYLVVSGSVGESVAGCC